MTLELDLMKNDRGSIRSPIVTSRFQDCMLLELSYGYYGNVTIDPDQVDLEGVDLNKIKKVILSDEGPKDTKQYFLDKFRLRKSNLNLTIIGIDENPNDIPALRISIYHDPNKELVPYIKLINKDISVTFVE